MSDHLDSRLENGELPFEFRARPVDEALREENWRKVADAIRRDQEAGIGVRPEERRVRKLPHWVAWAAAASVCFVTIGIWYAGSRTEKPPQLAELRTNYGEIKNILLPDSSLVILNANSALRIPQQWSDKGGRQVWLEGEAYFQVRKKVLTGASFVVHTRQVDVEVLGTKFNVNTRREHSVVALEEGKVQLSLHEGATTQASSPDMGKYLVLRPGQVVVIDGPLQTKVNTEKDVTAHSGWSRHEFHFDSTSLSEIARLIEDTYGYNLQVADTSLYKLTVSGDLRASNIQELVKVLEVALRLSMRIQDKTIYVTKP